MAYYNTYYMIGGKLVTSGGKIIYSKLTSRPILTISNSFNNTLMVERDSGKLWGWGHNGYGALGNNSTVSQSTPVAIGNVTNIKEITGGLFVNLILDMNGKLWCMGRNTTGQLGDGTITNKSVPTAVYGNHTFCKITNNNLTSFAIDNNKRLWGWGSNTNNILQNTSITSSVTPILIDSTRRYNQVSVGVGHRVSLDIDGRVWTIGLNANGQLGDNSSTSRSTPVLIYGGSTKTFCQISTNRWTSLGIDKNGRAWSWGYNTNGELGTPNDNNAKFTPIQVGIGYLGAGVKTFCKISSGYYTSIVIDIRGKIWWWGGRYPPLSGFLGLQTSPISLAGNKTFCQITINGYGSTYDDFAHGIDYNGDIWAWGPGSSVGQYGNNSVIGSTSPVSIYSFKPAIYRVSSSWSSFRIDYKGKLWSWGVNSGGQLGNNLTANKSTPIAVCGNHTFCQISAGSYFVHVLALDIRGLAWGWGYNNYGQLGINSTASKLTPVSLGKTFCKISTGEDFSLGIDKNGKLWGWGRNQYGALGDNTATSRSTPVAIYGTKTFCEIKASYKYSLAIDKNGKTWSFGYNDVGQLGDNTTTRQSTPIAVLGTTKTFCKISSGNNTSVALDKNGKSWTWGSNAVGQLGIGGGSGKYTPVAVCGVNKTFCHISASYHLENVLALTHDGKIYQWGYNNGAPYYFGLYYIVTPVLVGGTARQYCAISSGMNNIVIDEDTKTWGWGNNYGGGLGNNSTVSVLTPVHVYHSEI